eukprot:Amastigsp_a845410_13.p2 type:complete len:215 gc:universal Amastigsp_a845410_13:469-1113(+)
MLRTLYTPFSPTPRAAPRTLPPMSASEERCSLTTRQRISSSAACSSRTQASTVRPRPRVRPPSTPSSPPPRPTPRSRSCSSICTCPALTGPPPPSLSAPGRPARRSRRDSASLPSPPRSWVPTTTTTRSSMAPSSSHSLASTSAASTASTTSTRHRRPRLGSRSQVLFPAKSPWVDRAAASSCSIPAAPCRRLATPQVPRASASRSRKRTSALC